MQFVSLQSMYAFSCDRVQVFCSYAVVLGMYNYCVQHAAIIAGIPTCRNACHYCSMLDAKIAIAHETTVSARYSVTRDTFRRGTATYGTVQCVLVPDKSNSSIYRLLGVFRPGTWSCGARYRTVRPRNAPHPV